MVRAAGRRRIDRLHIGQIEPGRIKVAAALSAEQADDLSTPDQVRHYLRELARLNVESRRETAALMDASMRYGRASARCVTSFERVGVTDPIISGGR